MNININNTYKLATGQSLREQEKRLAYAFAAQLLHDYANLILATVNHSDVDNHDFEEGKEAVAREMIRYSSEIKPC